MIVMPEFIYNKLVRDKIVGQQKSEGYIVDSYSLDDESFLREVSRKVVEEAEEVAAAVEVDDRAEVVSEIADLQDLIAILIDKYDIDEHELLFSSFEKADRVGGFKDRVFIKTVTPPEGSKWVEYYRARPNKYPEV
jgi:predicted house-cleaning noncanonical NTP pyrophosphatase (MazG superfamily)